jgi:hypothetical protein
MLMYRHAEDRAQTLRQTRTRIAYTLGLCLDARQRDDAKRYGFLGVIWRVRFACRSCGASYPRRPVPEYLTRSPWSEAGRTPHWERPPGQLRTYPSWGIEAVLIGPG